MKLGGPITSRKVGLQEIAAENFGYFTATQAVACGYIKGHHAYHLQRRNWLKVAAGLYRLPGYADSMPAEFTKWYLWSRNQKNQPQGVISHQSALALWGLGEYDPREIHLIVPLRFQKKVPRGVVLHKSTLNLSEIELNGRVMVTRVRRTLQDLRPGPAEEGGWRRLVERAWATGRLAETEYRQLVPVDLVASGAQFDRAAIEAAVAPGAAGEPEPTGDLALNRERIYQMIFQRAQNATPGARRRAQAGFTLVELLVVIAIISILAGMLLPTLERAVSRARCIYCAGNMRQIYSGVIFYAGDNSGWMPPTSWNAQHIYYINEYLKQNYDAVQLNWLLFRKPAGLYFCPEQTRASTSPAWTGGPEAPFYFPNYMPTNNTYCPNSTNPRSGCWLSNGPECTSSVYSTTSPSVRRFELIKERSVIVGDQAYSTVAPANVNQCTRAEAFYNGRERGYFGTPGWLHANWTSNFLFKDGHVATYAYSGQALFDYDYILLP